MLVLYTTRTIRATSGLVKGVTAVHTGGVRLYVVDIVLEHVRRARAAAA